MAIQTTEKLKDVSVFTENHSPQIEVSPLGGNDKSGAVKIKLVDWINQEASRLTIFGTTSFMEDLERALNISNQERRREKLNVHAISKNSVEVPA